MLTAMIKKRVLLIGDSTARMVRSTLGKLIDMPVDLFATSSGLHDSLFINQMDCFFGASEYKYDCIFVQLGHHAELGFGGSYFSEKDWEIYRYEFKDLISFLKNKCRRVIIESVFYTVVPNKQYKLLKIFNIPEKYDEEVNQRKKKRNQIMHEIADEQGVDFLDINEYIQDKRFYHIDHIHFEEKAKPVIAKKMIEYIC